MKQFLILLLFSVVAQAQGPWYFGTGEAVNLTNGTAFSNGIKTIAGSLDPSTTAVSAPSGSMYFSSSGTTYVKQDNGLSTNWLPLGIAAAGSLSTINGQSGPSISIASGNSGTDFNIATASNTITLNFPSSSATNRGLLTSADWLIFNGKQDTITGAATTITSSDLTANRALISNGSGKVATSAVTDTELGHVSGVTSPLQTQLNAKESAIAAGTTSQYWRGDKTWQTLDKAAVGLANVDNTSDLDKPVSTATQAALDTLTTDVDSKVSGPGSSVDGEIALFNATTGSIIKRATGTGYVKATSGVYGTSATIPTTDLSGQITMANGGTGKALTAVNGGVVYTDADSQEVSAAGTSGQVLQSNGAAAPTWVDKSISTKSQTTGSLTLKEIQLPNSQLTQTESGKYRAEVGNKNILSNPSFEHQTASTSWSTTFASIGLQLSGSVDGAQHIQVSTTAQALDYYQDSTLYNAGFTDGVQGIASIWAKTTSSNIYVCPRNAGARVTVSKCAPVNSNGTWALYRVPFILGSTSNGVGVYSIDSSDIALAITGSVDVDDAFVGAQEIKQEVGVVGPWQTGSCTGSWTTNTTYTCKYRQVGDSIEVTGLMSLTGAPNATALTFNPPTGFTINNSSAPANTRLGTGYMQDASSGAANTEAILMVDPSTPTVIGVRPIGASTTTQTIPYTWANSDNIRFSYSVPVNELTGSVSTYTATNADTSWASCGHTTSDFIGFGTVTNIELQCKRDGDDILMRGKFTAGTSTATEARVILKFNGQTLTSKGSPAITSLSKVGSAAYSGSGSFFHAMLIEPSVSYLTMGVSYTSGASLTKANGNTVAGTGTTLSLEARIPIANWENSNVIIGTFKEVLTAPGITKPKMCTLQVAGASASTSCSASPCTEYVDTCGSFSACTRASSGNYSCALANGTFANSTLMTCAFQTSSPQSRVLPMYANSTGGGTVTVETWSTAGAAQDSYFTLECKGQAP